ARLTAQAIEEIGPAPAPSPTGRELPHTPTRYITVTETAKLVRAALKAAFPVVKFSVTSKSYSGGASISVGWVDGPTEASVRAVTGQYQGATFDGSIDLKEYHSSTLNGER